jgi:hypothetical protein
MIEIQPIKRIILPYKIEVEDIEEIYLNKGTQDEKISCLRVQIKTDDLKHLLKNGRLTELKLLYLYEDITSALCTFLVSYFEGVKPNVFYIHVSKGYRVSNPDEAIPWIRDMQMKSILD